ncbi:hypothetical protein [Phytoactinopolyspora mesophila]|uniref:Uncharacterized protein n=1 Tax=Phytoactinopolyspora mesophila TaxID=2650750 RepID=A0A7K3MAM9_9ACTN|nr:hypothetical protein [Phytoactinopolyspora mesophila]NDL60316.1 hypothetical protein [Phytoactinopolyspora mesophila]
MGTRLNEEAALNHRKTVTRRVFLSSTGAAAGAVFVGKQVAGSTVSPALQNSSAGEFPAPGSTSTAIVLDHPPQAKLATTETVLADPIDSSQSTFEVITPGGAPWTTHPTEFTTITDA